MRSIGVLLLPLGLVVLMACSQQATQESPTPGPTPQSVASPTPAEAESSPAEAPSPTPTEAARRPADQPTATPPTVKATATAVDASEERWKERLRNGLAYDYVWETNFELHSISFNEIENGGPRRDGIPPIDHPEFVSVEQANEWVDDKEPVQVVNINGDVRAYPIQIMLWHEIVNDTVGGEPVVVAY